MNCEELSFSQKLHDQRMARAEALLGANVVRKLVAYGLFLLGVTRNVVASFLDMPPGTVRSLVLGMHTKGLPALEDQRANTASFKPPAPPLVTPRLEDLQSVLRVNFGISDFVLDIPMSNTVQKRVVLLTFLHSGLLSRLEVGKALSLSADRVGKLARSLQHDDVESILDHRRGQQRDWRFTPEIKAKLIEQFVIDIVEHGQTSGDRLAEHLNERCQLKLSPRSILHHLSALGLSQIRSSLPAHLAVLKKNSSTS